VSIGKNEIMKEIGSWECFDDALRPEDRERYRRMMGGCRKYLPAIEPKASPPHTDALVRGIISLQHLMIQKLADKIERSADGKR
jgi:hypothetical protein